MMGITGAIVYALALVRVVDFSLAELVGFSGTCIIRSIVARP